MRPFDALLAMGFFVGGMIAANTWSTTWTLRTVVRRLDRIVGMMERAERNKIGWFR